MAKEDPDLSFALYMACCYVTLLCNLCIKNNRWTGCFVLAVGSVSDGSSAKRSAIF